MEYISIYLLDGKCIKVGFLFVLCQYLSILKMNNKIQDNELWSAIESYYRDNTLVDHQIESFNDYISRISSIIQEERIEVELKPPTLFKKDMFVAVSLEEETRVISVVNELSLAVEDMIVCGGGEKEKVFRKLMRKAKIMENIPDLFSETLDDIGELTGGNFYIEKFTDFDLDNYEGWTKDTKKEALGALSGVEKNKMFRPYADDTPKKYIVEFGEVTFQTPSHKEINDEVRDVFPKECIDRDITYSSNIFVDIEFRTPLGRRPIYRNFHIGSIPVMVGSNLCNLKKYMHDMEMMARLKENFYDKGGYFIVKGSPKIIATQQRTSNNRINAFQKRKSAPKFEYYTDVKSNSITGSHSTTTQVGLLKGQISVMVPYIDSGSIPLGVMFRALGIISEKDMVRYIAPLEDQELLHLLIPSLEYSYSCDSQEMALQYIGKKGKKFSGTSDEEEDEEEMKHGAISYAKHLIETEFLPHIGIGEEASVDKCFFLGMMVKKLIDAKLGRIDLEDRDHFANKRLATAGTLLTQQFYHSFKKLKNDITNAIGRCVTGNNTVNITSIIKPNTITGLMRSVLSINNWTGLTNAQGISQAYDQFNYSSSLANARKVNTPMSESGKVELPRKVHGSQYGALCPSETPEGKKVGLVNNLAVMTMITIGSDSEPLINIMKGMNIIPISEAEELHTLHKVFVNGRPLGLTDHPQHILNELVLMRRTASIIPETSISYSKKEKTIHISTEPGRVCRPLMVVENGELVLTQKDIREIEAGEWDDEASSSWVKLLTRGYIELIDKAEEENLDIVFYPSDLEEMDSSSRMLITHCEIHPSLMYGIGASLIPYPDHDQSPRVTYQAAMGKQAIGVPGSNWMFHTKGKFHVLNYPQKPLVSSKMSKIIGYDNLPSGQNAVVMICPWYGLNQEDSIIMNQDSIDRGFMLITTYMSYETKIKMDKDEKLEVPKKEECSNYRGNISKLDPITGIVAEGQYVEEGDVLIGKTIEEDPLYSIHYHKKKNVSVLYDHPWKGRVHLVQTGVDGQGYEFVRVVIAQERYPENGDKFAARHAQKGTIGERFRSYDLPFTSEGISPDIVVNPLAFPSRMTIGMLVEMMTGRKVVATSMLNHVPVNKVFREDGEDWEGMKENYGKNRKVKYSEFKSDGDATPFDKEFSCEKICEELRSLGINEFCDEEVINGQTGEPMNCLIFTGLCYYQRLKHMVIDKVHARSRGGHARLTRQPKEGRKLGGGFRVGIMERDALLAQGCPSFVKDRLMEQSDQHKMWFCRLCGLPALNIAGDREGGILPRQECRVCESLQCVEVKLPYATKLLAQELMAMNIVIRILTISYGEAGDYATIVQGQGDDEEIVGRGMITKVK